MEYLGTHGFSGLRSSYFLANEASRCWYRKMGFIERPDSSAVKHCLHFYHYEMSRLQADPRADPAEILLVEIELERWRRLAAERQIGPVEP